MAILERITRNVDNYYWYPAEDTFPVKNRYTVGVAGQRFFEEIKDNGRIYGTKCEKCGLTYVPARLYCERCFEELQQWVDVGTKGTVYSYTVAWAAKDGSKKEKPSIISAVKIADGILVHWLDECRVEDVMIGMVVEAVFKDKEERRGSLLDILYFKPV